MNSRAITKGILVAATSFALIDSLFAYQAFSAAVKPIVAHWAIELNQYCMDLKKQSITPKEWQVLVEKLFDKIELQELLRFIDFHNLQKGFQYPDLGVNTKLVKFPVLGGLPKNTVFVKKIFGMKKHQSIIPHGHSNMASAHNGKNYDIHNLDIYKKHNLPDGTMSVPILDVETALKIYGKETHH